MLLTLDVHLSLQVLSLTGTICHSPLPERNDKTVCNMSAEGSVIWGKNQFKVKIFPALAHISMGGNSKFLHSRNLNRTVSLQYVYTISSFKF